MLTPFLLLLNPSTFVSLPPLCFLSSNPQNASELRLTISLTILYTSAAEQWRTTTKNSGNRGTALLLLGVAPACPSIHIGLQRLTGAKETAREGGGGGCGVQVSKKRNNQTTSCGQARRAKHAQLTLTKQTGYK